MYQNDLFEGETAAVTGASRGRGRAVAQRLAEWGADVIVVARSIDSLAAVVDEIETETGSDALDVTVDVRNTEAIRRLANRTIDFGDGSVKIMYANAGTNFHALVTELSENAWRTIVDTNLDGRISFDYVPNALAGAGVGRR